MAFEKGHKGYKPSKPNKKTLILDSFAQTIVEGGMEKFMDELMKLKGNQFIYAYMTLFEYVKPKLARTELKADIEQKLTVTFLENDGTENNKS